MHSLKNTIVAVLLLGVSYGVYEILTTPDPSLDVDQSLIEPLVISEGDSNEIEPQPHIKLPESVALSQQAEYNRPKNGSIIPSQPPVAPDTEKQHPPSSNSEAIVSRQPKMKFLYNNDLGNHRASAETPDANSELPHDHELIEALKKQLGSEDDVGSGSFAPESRSEMVSIAARPNQPTSGDFESRETRPQTELPIEPETNLADTTTANLDFAAVWDTVEQMTGEEQFQPALRTLTRYYKDPNLTRAQQNKLLAWLDALAGKVIYSAEHHLAAQPYVVRPNETLIEIADRWNVPTRLVYNINSNAIQDASNLTPGTELKVVTGPFHAEVDVNRKTLTIFVGDLYAGRFEIKIGNELNMKPGRYRVTEMQSKVQTDEQFASEDEHGPYWIGLEGGLCIHAVTQQMGSQHQQCIGLSAKDAADLYSIFTTKSQIFIAR